MFQRTAQTTKNGEHRAYDFPDKTSGGFNLFTSTGASQTVEINVRIPTADFCVRAPRGAGAPDPACGQQ